jgi:hypothetical protein
MMRFSMTSVVLLVGFGCASTPGWAADILSGDWSGSYTCYQGITQLALVIMPDGEQWSGRFMFGPHKVNKDVPFGSYNITVTEEDGVYTMHPGAWIDRPDGYVAIGGSGTMSADLTTLSGTLDFDGCETFEATRQTPVPGGKTK